MNRNIIIKNLLLLFMLVLAGLIHGCGSKPTKPLIADDKQHSDSKTNLLNYTIQAGAFSYLDNALRLTEKLKGQGLDAYYFIHESGLYKVRFGNYQNYAMALSAAKLLKNQNQIEDFYIVRPDDYIIAGGPGLNDDVRKSLVSTAERFLGVPYLWGGISKKTGFDCSGLSMVVYKLNGINLPRTSRAQYRSGREIDKEELQRGDLVFFATGRGKKVSHVGIYKGDGHFIHAPRRGKGIKISSLNNGYFKNRFIGAKTYL